MAISMLETRESMLVTVELMSRRLSSVDWYCSVISSITANSFRVLLSMERGQLNQHGTI